jgi:hypothetical protein
MRLLQRIKKDRIAAIAACDPAMKRRFSKELPITEVPSIAIHTNKNGRL